MKKIFILIIVIFTINCVKRPEFQIFKLPNGKEYKIVSTGIHLSLKGEKAPTLTYICEEIGSRKTVEKQAKELWKYWKKDVEKKGYKRAVIMAKKLTKKKSIVRTYRVETVVFKKINAVWIIENKL